MTRNALNPGDLAVQLAPLAAVERWYVALSGGMDSSVLLHLLQHCRRELPAAPELIAIHVNHGLHSDAGRWQDHCRQLCDALGVPLVTETVDTGSAPDGIEAAAREARYRVFEDQLGAGDVLFMAHHLDDQVETFFLRLMRGAGLEGLAGMPSERALGQGRLVRPLLDVPRTALVSYAAEQDLPFVDDPSNRDTRLDRNYVRHEILPALAARWPGYRRTVSRAQTHLGDASRLLQQSAPAPATRFSRCGDPGIGLADLLPSTPEAAQQVLRAWLLSRGLPMPDAARLVEFVRQLRDARDDARPQLSCSAYTLQRYRDGVYLLPGAESAGSPTAPLKLAPGQALDLGGGGQVALVPVPARGFALTEGEAVELRWRRGGERCQPLAGDHSLPLKQLLQEAAIPPWWRDRVPLVYWGEELLAVADLALCRSSRARDLARPGEGLWQLSWRANSSASPIEPAGPF